MKRVGVDVGWNLHRPDLRRRPDRSVLVHKLPTTPDDPSEGTVRGIQEITEQAGESPSSLDEVFHGTTIATNIVIEHNGARVGMLTTEGYRDILHIARHKKPYNFSIYQDLPWQRYPIVRRRDRLTVPERTERRNRARRARRGEGSRAGATAEGVRRRGGRRVLPLLLPEPEHEERVAEIVREELPEAFLSVPPRCCPVPREYERFSTVCP